MGGKPPYNQGSSFMRKHGLRVLSRQDCSVEGCVLAIGQAVCYRNVKYAPRMNRDAMVFLSKELLVHTVLEKDIHVKDTLAAPLQ